nr:hypothetical protein [Tanacetum cinerariifolium]
MAVSPTPPPQEISTTITIPPPTPAPPSPRGSKPVETGWWTEAIYSVSRRQIYAVSYLKHRYAVSSLLDTAYMLSEYTTTDVENRFHFLNPSDGWSLRVLPSLSAASMSGSHATAAVSGSVYSATVAVHGVPEVGTPMHILARGGSEAHDKKDGIFLSQDKYVGDILKKFGYSDVRSANTPMDKENPWGKDGTRKDVDLHLYRSMIGSLMYLTASRPDIMFAICACARHQVTPKECHMHAVKRIFRYFKGHPKLGVWYPKDSPFDLVAYSDSDYGGATQDRKSTTEGCQFLGRRLISWKCKKQKIVSTSTTKAEYVAAACGYRQVLWIQN